MRVTTRNGAPCARGSTGADPAWIDLSHFSIVAFEGADAKSFLQGYLTCDMDALTPTNALIGALCNLQGRVVADVVAAECDHRVLLWTHASIAQDFFAALRKYLVFSKSKATLLDWVALGQLHETPVHAPWTTMPEADGLRIALPGAQARSLLLLPLSAAVELTRSEGVIDATSWDVIDIEARWAHVTHATTASFLPQMLGYTALGAVSFSKGCYLGQEVVARAEHRGAVKRQLSVATWHGATIPDSGEPILDGDGQRRATLIMAAGDPDQGVALIVAPSDFPGRGSTAAGVTIEVR